jgi:hypothetical protein
MIREFRVDRDRIYDFHKKFLQRVAKYMAIILIPVMVLIFSSYDGMEDVYGAAFFIISFVIAFAGVMGQTGNSTFKAFEKTKIILEEGRVIRMGDGLMTSRISYKEIGRIAHLQHGIVIIKRGIFPFLNYHFSRYALTLHHDIIFIPYLLKDYDILKDFFINKKYLRVDISV